MSTSRGARPGDGPGWRNIAGIVAASLAALAMLVAFNRGDAADGPTGANGAGGPEDGAAATSGPAVEGGPTGDPDEYTFSLLAANLIQANGLMGEREIERTVSVVELNTFIGADAPFRFVDNDVDGDRAVRTCVTDGAGSIGLDLRDPDGVTLTYEPGETCTYDIDDALWAAVGTNADGTIDLNEDAPVGIKMATARLIYPSEAVFGDIPAGAADVVDAVRGYGMAATYSAQQSGNLPGTVEELLDFAGEAPGGSAVEAVTVVEESGARGVEICAAKDGAWAVYDSVLDYVTRVGVDAPTCGERADTSDPGAGSEPTG